MNTLRVEIKDMVEASRGTAEQRRAFLEGVGFAIQHIQSYAMELFLNGDHYSEVPAERLRDLANQLQLDSGKVMRLVHALEEQDKQDKATERELMLVHPPEKPPFGETFLCPECKGLFPNHKETCSMHVKLVSTKPPSAT